MAIFFILYFNSPLIHYMPHKAQHEHEYSSLGQLFSLANFSIGVYSLRFRISHSLYLCIAHAVEEHDEYFVKQKIEMDILAYHVYRWLH
jgi:hypothetical protein